MLRCSYLPSAAALVLMLAPASGPAASRQTGQLDAKLRQAWEALAENLPREGAAHVAVLPFADGKGGLLKLGRVAADRLAQIVTTDPQAQLVDREHLRIIQSERQNWEAIPELFELHEPHKAEAVRAGKWKRARIKKAEYLVVGRFCLPPSPGDIQVAVKLLHKTSRASVFNFQLPRRDYRDLLRYDIPPPGSEQAPVPEAIELHAHLVGQWFGLEGTVVEGKLNDGGTLRSGEQFQIHFRAEKDCYVYVALFDSQGRASLLFPFLPPHPHPPAPRLDPSEDQVIQLDNRVEAGKLYVLPDPSQSGGSRWFRLDDHPGTETIYIVASTVRMAGIESLIRECARDAKAAPRLRHRLEDLQAMADAIENLLYEKFWGLVRLHIDHR